MGVNPSLDIAVESVKTACQDDSVITKKLTQKAYLNAAAAFLDYGARLTVGFIVTPILVNGLGSLLYGVWQILNRLIGHISAVDGRPTQALKWVVANNQVSDDYAKKRREVGSAIGVWMVFLPFLLIAGIIVVWLSPTITKVSPEQYSVIRFACVILAVNLLLSGFVALPEAVLKGMNLGYKRMGVVASITVVGGFLTAGAIYLGFGLIGVAWAQVVISIITGVIFWFLVRKYVPWFGIARPSMSEVKKFTGLSIWYTIWAFINKLLLASDVVVLGIVASASSVSTYTLTGYPPYLVESLIALSVGSVTPGLGGVIGQKQYKKAVMIRREMMQTSWLLITACGATILLWNRSFIDLWVGSDYYAGFWVNLLILLVVMQLIFIRIDAFIIDLTLNLRFKVIFGAIAAILSICLAVVLIPLFGIEGLCIALILGRIVLTVSYPLIVSSFLSASIKSQLADLVRPALVTAILFASACYLGQDILVSNWIVWMAFTFSSFGLIFCIGFYTGFNTEQREQLIGRIKTVRFFSFNVG